MLGNFIPRHVLNLEILLPMVRQDDLHRLPQLFADKCMAKGILPQERTRERLMHPLLLAKLRSAAPPGRDVEQAWKTLGRFVDLVVGE